MSFRARADASRVTHEHVSCVALSRQRQREGEIDMVNMVKSDERIVRKMLAKLPHDPYSIARFLDDRNVRGDRNSATSCPLANWVKSTVGDSCYPEVSGYSVDLYDHPDDNYSIEIDVPQPVTDFVKYFDRGYYPLLVAD